MSLQWATRAGVLRHLHLDHAMARPGRVTGLQNQLRHLSLSSQPRLTPRVGVLSAITSQQSHSYATDASRPTPKKATKATDGTRKKSTAPTKKRELTEKQKEKLKEDKEKKKQRDHINALKETALEPPKKLTVSAHLVALQSKLAELKSQYPTQKEAFGAASSAVKDIPAHEYERHQIQAAENRAANEAALISWLKSYTPLQIKKANVARRALAKLTGKPYKPIQDDRQVKRPLIPFVRFANERKASGDLKSMAPTESFKRIGEEWKSLTEAEKEPFNKLYREDQERYDREYKETYGVERQPVKSD
ncbi:hypothetical protein N7520_000694 [Penicillium odoratum]|uniref:uncharacterized protein n=1 Tax=Penicillium odoratum TaxID=1167516 RepID=UPI002546E9ED|nr:uncharacterized protein N7520_000694 [Penicillium odoratum]KAJ5777448.1 hypothetical protein N7520_000694 [Penicillium odoratum]